MDGALGDIFYGQNWEAEPVGFPFVFGFGLAGPVLPKQLPKGVDADDE